MRYDDDRFVLDQQAQFDLHNAGSQKQQSMGRHVTPLGHIILISSQPVFALTPQYCMVSKQAAYTNFIVFAMTLPRLKTTIYHIQGKHAKHYTTDVVPLYILMSN